MSTVIDDAVGGLIKKHGSVSYTDNGKEVSVISKPAHYSLRVQLIDKEARKKKKASVRFDKKYTYPKEIEQAVLWDVLKELRESIINHTGQKGMEAWNNTFGKAWPELSINTFLYETETDKIKRLRAQRYQRTSSNKEEKGRKER